MEYKILVGIGKSVYSAREQLENKVKEFISSNWKPKGGISLTYETNGLFTYSQAMIKE